MSRPISVLIADDHTMFGESLANNLKRVPDIQVVGVVTNGDDAVTQTVELKPDIVLMDIDMPGVSCFDAARIITEHCPRSALVFVSAHTHDHYIACALEVQAAGYVTKNEPLESVVAAIRAAASGGAYFSAAVQERIVLDRRRALLVSLTAPVCTRLSLLTRRELSVLRYIARGLQKRDIAEKLGIRTKTVETHTANLMDKLSIHDRVELARYAIREGLANP